MTLRAENCSHRGLSVAVHFANIRLAQVAKSRLSPSDPGAVAGYRSRISACDVGDRREAADHLGGL